MGNALRLIAFTGSIAAVIVIGCGDDDKDEGTGLPRRNNGAEDAGESSSGSTPDSGTTYDCTNHASVDDRPACDQCAKAKCCEWITKCDQSPQCKSVQNCLAACASDDLVCVLSCQATAGTGAETLQELGACASNECPSECPGPSIDAGFDAL